MILACVLLKFSSRCLEYYRLDPCHYFSSPGLSWDVMVKTPEIKLEPISDMKIHVFIEEGKRGGISYISKRYTKANNKNMKVFNSSKESKLMMWLDANNLTCWFTNNYLPYGGFKWLSQEEIKNFDVNSVSENNADGYIYIYTHTHTHIYI